MAGIVLYFSALAFGAKWLQATSIVLTAIVGGRSIFILVRLGFEDDERMRKYESLRNECEVPVPGDGISYVLKGTNKLPNANNQP